MKGKLIKSLGILTIMIVLGGCGNEGVPVTAGPGLNSGSGSPSFSSGLSGGITALTQTPAGFVPFTATAALASTPPAAGTAAPNPTTAAPATTLARASTTLAVASTATTTRISTVSTSATTGTTASNQAESALPVYNGLKPVNLGPAFEQALAQGITGQGGGATYAIYTTAEAVSKIIEFYDEALKKAGYIKAGEQDIPLSGAVNLGGKLEAYQKGTPGNLQAVVITVLGPVDAPTVTLLGSQNPGVAGQLKPGDFIVITFNNLSPRSVSPVPVSNPAPETVKS